MKTESTVKRNIVSLLMGICMAGAIALIAVFSGSWQSASQVFQISSELFCMIVVLVVYIWHLRRIKSSDERLHLFALLCVVLYLTLFVDLIAWSVNGIAGIRWLHVGIRVLSSLLTFIYGVIFIEYIFSYLDVEKSNMKLLRRILTVLVGICIGVRLFNLFTGRYFIIDAGNRYSPGPFYILSMLAMPVMHVFMCGIVAGQELSNRRLIAFLSSPIAMFCMIGIISINADYGNPLIAISLSLIFIYCANFLDTEANRDTLDKNMRVYLSEDIVSHLTASEGGAVPGGSVVRISMIFGMLHSFSNELETMGPEDAMTVLNHFFQEMTDVIADNEGTLLEFPGYGFFCIFGAYNTKSNHASAAVRAARQIQERMKTVNRWNSEHGFPELEVGIGINTGDVVLGNIGSKNHLRYTAISRHVNLASRIETYSTNGSIVVTQNTLDASDNIAEAEKIMTVIPKGISEPMNIYRVVRVKEE